MACARCSDCGISFPSGTQKCLGCGGKLDRIDNASPQADFRRVAEQVREGREEAERVAELIPSFKAKVIHRNGQYFTSSWDINQNGYHSQLLPDTIIRIGYQFFEVGGYSANRREYWLLLVGEEIEEDSAAPAVN